MNVEDKIYQSLHLLYRYQWDHKTRLGRGADGGYTVASGLLYDLLLAGGVAGDISFEEDFLERHPEVKKGFGFDGTVEEMPDQKNKKLKLIKKNIGPVSTDTETDLIEYMGNYKDIFLKMDIETHEFSWILESAVDFSKFKQIVIEMHPFGSGVEDLGLWPIFIECLDKLCETHKLIHIHPNNIAEQFEFRLPSWPEGKSITLPRVLEMTFVRNDEFNKSTLERDTRPIPQSIDIVNFSHMPEVYLYDFPWT